MLNKSNKIRGSRIKDILISLSKHVPSNSAFANVCANCMGGTVRLCPAIGGFWKKDPPKQPSPPNAADPVFKSIKHDYDDVEIKSYLQDVAGHGSLVFDLSITHDRIGNSGHVQQNGLLSHPQDLDAPSRLAAQSK